MTTATLKERAFVEALGTFLLVFLGGGALITSAYFFPQGASQLLSIALAYGFALAIAVSISMNISGGHINPAVTIAMYATKRIKGMEAAVYIAAQLIGAIIGAAMLLGFPGRVGFLSAWSVPTLSPIVGVFQGIFIEALITFVLVTAVFWTAVDKRAPKMGGFGIGLALFIGILVAGPLTGAAANPARALGPEIATLNFTNWYVYIIGPIIGALVAAVLYSYFSEKSGK